MIASSSNAQPIEKTPSIECKRGFDALFAEVSATVTWHFDASDEMLEIFKIGNTEYIFTKHEHPAHPAIFTASYPYDAPVRISGCAFGNIAAFDEAVKGVTKCRPQPSAPPGVFRFGTCVRF